MRAPSRKKTTSNIYKGWRYVQTPWGGNNVSMTVYDPDGKERLHAGYSKFCPRKKMREVIKECIKMFEVLESFETLEGEE